MKNTNRILIVSLALIFSGLFMFVPFVKAVPGAPCVNDVDCSVGETCVGGQCQLPTGGGPPPSPGGGGGGGSVSIPNPISASSTPQILNNIVNFLLLIAAPIAVAMAIWSGYLFLTSGGSEEKVKTARKTLLYVVIGIVVLIISKGLVSIITSVISS